MFFAYTIFLSISLNKHFLFCTAKRIVHENREHFHPLASYIYKQLIFSSFLPNNKDHLSNTNGPTFNDG